MLKKMLALVLCLVLATALVACTETGTDNTDGENTAASTDSNTEKTSDKKNEVDLNGWDDTMEHKFLATDVANKSIIVVDLGLSKTEDFSDLSDCVVWEWESLEDPNCKGSPGAGLDAAKLRYSEHFKKDVVVACSSNGWAGIIDYEAEVPTVLWEWSAGSGNFHSIELMPNGDVVVAGSGEEGKIYYIPLSAGEVRPSHTIDAPNGHGVMYDPQNNFLWCLDYDEVFACKVSGYGSATAKLSRINGFEAKFPKENDGHVLSPVFGQPGKYWVTNSTRNHIFDSEKLTLSYAPSQYTNNTSKGAKELGIKGIAYYPDKTMVMTVSNTGTVTAEHFCGEIRIVKMVPSTGKIKKLIAKTYNVTMEGREFYKVYPLSKDYQ